VTISVLSQVFVSPPSTILSSTIFVFFSFFLPSFLFLTSSLSFPSLPQFYLQLFHLFLVFKLSCFRLPYSYRQSFLFIFFFLISSFSIFIPFLTCFFFIYRFRFHFLFFPHFHIISLQTFVSFCSSFVFLSTSFCSYFLFSVSISVFTYILVSSKILFQCPLSSLFILFSISSLPVIPFLQYSSSSISLSRVSIPTLSSPPPDTNPKHDRCANLLDMTTLH
jgi:hypothetical protein